jgi:hypothetical protein
MELRRTAVGLVEKKEYQMKHLMAHPLDEMGLPADPGWCSILTQQHTADDPG